MTSSNDWRTIDVARGGNVARLRLNRPDRRNAVSPEMVAEIHAALLSIADSDASVLVFTGTGDTFCPGADLRRAVEDPGARPELPDPATYHSARLLHEMPQVTLAAVNGGCAGAGIGYAAACDLRVATARARFATAFLEVGLAGELGLSWTLLRHLGGAWARDISFLPRKLTADDALRLGLVTRVFPDETFAAEVDALVTELAGRRPEAIRTLKANFLDAERLPLREYIDIETERHQAPFRGADAGAAHERLAEQGARVSSS
jgi:2-(1,2-epoxy-1,2-dihydrophenyl)acetyl-CoA isomerase